MADPKPGAPGDAAQILLVAVEKCQLAGAIALDVIQVALDAARAEGRREERERAARIANELGEKWRNQLRHSEGRPTTGAMAALAIARAIEAEADAREVLGGDRP